MEKGLVYFFKGKPPSNRKEGLPIAASLERPGERHERVGKKSPSTSRGGKADSGRGGRHRSFTYFGAKKPTGPRRKNRSFCI